MLFRSLASVYSTSLYTRTYHNATKVSLNIQTAPVLYAVLSGQGSILIETDGKSITCSCTGVAVVCMIWREDKPRDGQITFSVTPSSVGDVRQLSVEIVGGDFVELKANKSTKIKANGIKNIVVVSNLEKLQQTSTSIKQRIVFEIEKIKKIAIKDSFAIDLSSIENKSRKIRFTSPG